MDRLDPRCLKAIQDAIRCSPRLLVLDPFVEHRGAQGDKQDEHRHADQDFDQGHALRTGRDAQHWPPLFTTQQLTGAEPHPEGTAGVRWLFAWSMV